MRALLLLLLTLLAGPAAAQDPVSLTGCKDDQVDCREECTVEYGGSTRTYDKLGACLQKCKQKYDKCREHQFALQERERLKKTPLVSYSDAYKGTAAASKGEAVESTGPSDVPFVFEPAPAPEPEAIPDTTELDQLFDEQKTPPPPSPKPKPESQKKDATGEEPTEK